MAGLKTPIRPERRVSGTKADSDRCVSRSRRWRNRLLHMLAMSNWPAASVHGVVDRDVEEPALPPCSPMPTQTEAMNAYSSAAAIARIRTFAFAGIEAVPVEVQVQISAGVPAFLVVGLPDKAVGEARERVRAALAAMGLSLPPRRVLINLAPADLAKEGSHFDLPLALGVLAAMDVLPRDEIDGYAALGELHLDGTLHPVAGVLPAAMGASARDLGLICPAARAARRPGPAASRCWPRRTCSA